MNPIAADSSRSGPRGVDSEAESIELAPIEPARPEVTVRTGPPAGFDPRPESGAVRTAERGRGLRTEPTRGRPEPPTTRSRLVLPKPAAAPASARPEPSVERGPKLSAMLSATDMAPSGRPRPTKAQAPELFAPWVSRIIVGSAVLTLALVVFAFLKQGDDPVPLIVGTPQTSPPTRVVAGRRTVARRTAPGHLVPTEPGETPKDPHFGRARKVKPFQMWSPERIADLANTPYVGKPFTPFVDTGTYDRPYETYDTIEQEPYIFVMSRPPGMNVYFDDVIVGRTPLLRHNVQHRDRIRIRIAGSGFETVEREIRQDKQGHIRIGVVMKPVLRR